MLTFYFFYYILCLLKKIKKMSLAGRQTHKAP